MIGLCLDGNYINNYFGTTISVSLKYFIKTTPIYMKSDNICQYTTDILQCVK